MNNFILEDNKWTQIDYTPSSLEYKSISLFNDDLSYKGKGYFRSLTKNI